MKKKITGVMGISMLLMLGACKPLLVEEKAATSEDKGGNVIEVKKSNVINQIDQIAEEQIDWGVDTETLLEEGGN